jgi:hypothetical protein
MEHLDVSDHRGCDNVFSALVTFIRQSPRLKVLVFDGLGPHPCLHRFLLDMSARRCTAKISFPSRDVASLLAAGIIGKSSLDALLRAFRTPYESFYLQKVRIFRYDQEDRMPLWMTSLATSLAGNSIPSRVGKHGSHIGLLTSTETSGSETLPFIEKFSDIEADDKRNEDADSSLELHTESIADSESDGNDIIIQSF